MSQRRLKQLLWTCCVLACVGAAALGAWAVRTTPTMPVRNELSESGFQTAGMTDSAGPTLDTYAQAWELRLRRPLNDLPPVAPVRPAVPIPTAQINVRLVGTILEAGRSLGIFIGPAGKMELLGVGERVGEAEILSINLENATLLHQGQEVTLTIPKEKWQ